MTYPLRWLFGLTVPVITAVMAVMIVWPLGGVRGQEEDYDESIEEGDAEGYEEGDAEGSEEDDADDADKTSEDAGDESDGEEEQQEEGKLKLAALDSQSIMERKRNFYEFSMSGGGDPFVPSVTPVHFNESLRDVAPVDTPPGFRPGGKFSGLELDKIKLVGMWKSDGEYKALLTTAKPSGGSEIVKVGDFVGKGNGKIIEIGQHRVLIRRVIMSSNDVRTIEDLAIYLSGRVPMDAEIVSTKER